MRGKEKGKERKGGRGREKDREVERCRERKRRESLRKGREREGREKKKDMQTRICPLILGSPQNYSDRKTENNRGKKEEKMKRNIPERQRKGERGGRIRLSVWASA